MYKNSEIALRDDYSSFHIGDGYTVLYRGALFYAPDRETTIYDVSSVCRMFVKNELDFNKLHGSFRIIIINENTGECTFWGDNSGLLVFYYRKNGSEFSDCLLKFKDPDSRTAPDYRAVAQYLQYGYVLSFDTLIDGVVQTDPEYYYSLQCGAITAHSKELLRIAEMHNNLSVSEITERSMKAASGRYGSVCTGGTDSRTILAWVYNLGGRPEMAITGRGETADVQIAEQISQKLGLHLNKIDSEKHDSRWIDEAFDASGGITELNTAYRLLKKAQSNRSRGIEYEFGGVAGELYKNEFMSKDYPFYELGHANAGKFAKHFFSSVTFSDSLLGANTSAYTSKEMIRRYAKSFESMIEGGKFPSYNNIGYHIMMRKYAAISNGFSNYFIPLHPLTDRDVVAGVSKRSARSLETQRWHREEIALACPQIAEIRTSLGYTCSYRPAQIFKEGFEQRCAFARLAFNYLKKKLSTAPKTVTQWDNEYSSSKNTAEYTEAAEICKELGIFRQDADPMDFPPFAAGRILLLGRLYK